MGGITTKLRSAADDAIDEIVSLCDSLRDTSRECGKLRSEVGRLKAELAKLQAERESIDNGDGTVTAMLPVTYPNGLDVEQVREPKIGDEFISDIGERMTCTLSPRNGGRIRLILRPAPKPPEPVTWVAPLVDGEWLADEEFVARVGGSGYGLKWGHVRGLSKPAKLGTYQFKDGVGTLVEVAQ